MPKVRANGIEIYYETAGNEEKPPLVLVGGLSRDHTIWEAAAKNLAGDFYVIAFDNRGSGRTECPKGPYSTEILGEDISGLLKALGIPKAHILGHSMGGYAAQFMAARHPEQVDKLVLCCTTDKPLEMALSYLEQCLVGVRAGVPFLEMMKEALPLLFAPDFLTEEREAKLLKDIESAPYPITPAGLEGQILACLGHDASQAVSSIKAPTLVLTGSEDLLMPPEVGEALASKIRGARHFVIDGAAHMVQVENLDAFCQAVREFLMSCFSEGSVP